MNREPVLARPASAWERTVRWTSRHPVLTTATVALVLFATIMSTALATLWRVDHQPVAIRVSPDEKQALLLNWRGEPFLSVPEPPPRDPATVRFAYLFKEAGTAVLGITDGDPDYPGGLYGFDPVGGHRRWLRDIEEKDMPRAVLQDRPARRDFTAIGALHVNVFAEPGDRALRELVVWHTNMWSDRAIRVYSGSGDVLYQVWHKGHVGGCYFMSGPGVLVFAGDGGSAEDGKYLTVFALRPVQGFVSNEYLSSTSADSRLRVLWRKKLTCREPIQLHGKVGLTLGVPKGQSSANHVSLTVTLDSSSKASFQWMLSDQGEIVGEPLGSDTYDRSHQGLPPLSAFDLVPVLETR